MSYWNKQVFRQAIIRKLHNALIIDACTLQLRLTFQLSINSSELIEMQNGTFVIGFRFHVGTCINLILTMHLTARVMRALATQMF